MWKRTQAYDLFIIFCQKTFQPFLLVIFDTQARSHGKLWGIRAKKAKEAEQADEIAKGKK